MAALLRTQDALDLETAIREWQSRQSGRQPGGPAPEPDEKSAVARLTAALDTLFREIVLLLSDKGKFPRDIFISLDRSRSCFSLWSDGHGVASGTLDDKFQRSLKLRQAMMKTLSHLSSTLIDRLVPVAHISNPMTKGLCNQVSNILEEVNFSHVADDSSSDSTSEYSTVDVHELAEDLKTDVDCLIELDQMIRDPATDPEPDTTEAEVSLTLWAPHQVFADKIEHRFPRADVKLFSSLGMVNYQRYLRCQTERDTNQVHGEQTEQPAEVAEGSKFHDSGLGSSLNPASSYAETIMSYKDGNRSIRIPPLPEQAKNGEPFSCIACGRSVTMTTNSQWKRHLYLDLQPYVCLDTSCRLSNSTFSNRANWLQHLALDHGMEPKWEQINCPLCGDEIGPGKLAITTHLGRHLEEISLSALPAAPDSESNSEPSGSEIDDIHEWRQSAFDVSKYMTVGDFAASSDWAPFFASQPPTSPPPQSSSVPLVTEEEPSKTLHESLMEKQTQGDDTLSQAESPISHEQPSEALHEWELERQRAQREQAVYGPDVQIHNDQEADFHRRMEEIEIAQKETKREIEIARAEGEEAAYRRLKAEQKAEQEERARLWDQAIAAAEERIKAEHAEEDRLRAKLKTMEATRQAEADARDRAEAAAREKMLEIEEALRRRRKDMKDAQEEAIREIAKAKAEAENTARERARQKFEAEIKAAEVRRQSEAESRAKAEEVTEAATKDAEAAARDAEDEGEALAKARYLTEKDTEKFIAETMEKFKAAQKAVKALKPDKLLSGAPVSEFGIAEGKTEENHKTRPHGNQLDKGARGWRILKEEQMAMNDDQGNAEQMQNQPSDQMGQMSPNIARAEAEDEARERYRNQQRVSGGRQHVEAELGAQGENLSLTQAEGLDRIQRVARLRLKAQLKAAEARQDAEAEVHDKAEGEARVDLDAAVHTTMEEHAQEPVETTPAPDSPRNEVSETTHDDPLTMVWRWRCPSCGSNDQDRRKGPECSNCSYLFGDGDEIGPDIKHNEANKLKREALSMLVAAEAKEKYARKMTEAAELLLRSQHALDSGAPKEAPTKPVKTRATSTEMKRERAPQAEHRYKSQHTEQDPNGPFALDDPPKSPDLYSTNKEYTPKNPLTILRAEFPSATATDHWATADKDWLLSSSEPAKMQRSSNLQRRAAQAQPRALQSARTSLLSPKPRNIEGQLDLMEHIFGIDRHTAGLKQRLNPARSDNGPLPSPDPRHLSVPHSALPPIQPDNDIALPPIQPGNAKGIDTALPSFNAVRPGSTGPGKNLYDPDANWSKITEPGERRRLSNRMAQRAFRRHTKERSAGLGHQEGEIWMPANMNDDPSIDQSPISGRTSLQRDFWRQDGSVADQDPQTDNDKPL
ncbi:hypothetical protein CEP54_007553 [Fusarium duplospermum]|uniref:Oxidoreductase acuF-like C2H2 type zinc-finger domain-containing protein n=1 Tax=Fusarium duplospermum TaxID=1325734 RepID=A0A428Q0K8_9HYPO|nr:hypothetical protein CEP54_007553 [Fusarium duplospermum]